MSKIELANTTGRNTREKQNVNKICREKGCGKKYYGHPITKYCEFHRDPKNRKKKDIIKTDITDDNQIFMHDFKESLEIMYKCEFKGCEEQFKIKIIPKIYVYPKYCDNHRSQYKRSLKEYYNESGTNQSNES